MAGAELGGDTDEGDLDVRKGNTADHIIKQAAQPLSGNKAGTTPGDVEQRQDAPPRQAQAEFAKSRAPTRGMKPARKSADLRTGDGRSNDAMLFETLNDANMRPAARRSRAKRQADGMSYRSIHAVTLHRARKIGKSQIIS